jgi:hypothetical protein
MVRTGAVCPVFNWPNVQVSALCGEPGSPVRIFQARYGVFGMQGISLTSAASSVTEASVVTSEAQNVHLDSGTQMVLRAAKQ